MKRMLLLSLILFAAAWACCHSGPQQSNATAKPVAGATGQAPQTDVASFDEDADLTPTEGLGYALFFIALAIPMVIVIVKLGSRESGG